MKEVVKPLKEYCPFSATVRCLDFGQIGFEIDAEICATRETRKVCGMPP